MALNEQLAQNVVKETPQQALELVRKTELESPSDYLDAHREQCRIIITAQGFVGLAKATGLSAATIRGWARRRGLYTPRKRSKVAPGSPKGPQVARSSPNPSASLDYYKGKAEALEFVIRQLLARSSSSS